MRRESPAHVWDAVESATAVRTFVAGRTESEFLSDLLLRSAVERQLEILGEALNRLRQIDPETATRIPDLRRIIGMRNVIAHEYGTVDYEIVWSAVTTRVPELIGFLQSLLEEAPTTLE
ncbi:DUF86 domain-containing protein [Aeromicrobium sp. YIM 150415]|uniref:DUF86 domain-containing protein n=1 Tax=Aeromicrobium piscarium TaxID=2590901 RepID=A0A554SPB2_9ACTN|nr:MULTISPECIES: HepT-like ribonuclease domain-containing protein [Aeromicrobium]MBM9462399.1 DUF86 domain-containing protein [Aeromicrobium sp. YIM 150415]TSD68180.1 DUF86 domain-containing protein [Aeromicrobium piscarium]